MTDTIEPTDTWQTPFLQGLLAPVSDERDDADLTVIGELPSGLEGHVRPQRPESTVRANGGVSPVRW